MRAAALAALLVLAPSCGRGEGGAEELRRAFPPPIGDVVPGQTVERLHAAAPGIRFTPYDGLHGELAEPWFGFRTLAVATGELFPERPPSPAERVQEIRLRGDTVDASVVAHLEAELPAAAYRERCIQRIGADVRIWETRGGFAVELTMSPAPPHRGTLRITRGRWRGDPLTRTSVGDRCPRRAR